MAVSINPGQDTEAVAVGATGPTSFVGATGATGATGPGTRRKRALPPPPLLHLVQPGDLITAQYFNDLVLAVQNLQARVDDLEQVYDYYSYRETWAAR